MEEFDFKTTRHCALFFRPEVNKIGEILHASGSPQNYVLQRITGYKAESSHRLVGSVRVLESSQTPDTLRAIAEQVPVNNNESGWNCQNWVGDALARFVQKNLITAAERSTILDEMIDIVLQSEDDQPT
ncbi:hypothetical protein AJ80_02229 [Polytolypa hystricis UAMH7299]|uniref:Uncharacterized protein n=1 Tax=Polytolypa hystricis (strain UAMH7299) TaxID=1447883 RepID=A0A2B7YRJ9_POLH7|nr:hypothetical protein AJ80_02229 [Polytolypa hystricis UAMH7299]